ncbi:5867_t:CDS:2 [Ambispora gerdemannii]|uniref:5867_t:CDS:1 n=1 Tax=Ambispora gerdemannii TaxID=144530 RepID=A0A9N8W4X7_9GLOM|nr:5867_t:CDS:2 [Ambispora gerdemannii]
MNACIFDTFGIPKFFHFVTAERVTRRAGRIFSDPAQKYLAEAIAHNDDSKRKLEQLGDFVTQIPLKASHNLNITSIPHADLSGQESLPDSPQSPQDSSEPQKKKPGRKPLTNTPSSKRKAQNRAAQRAFRERKERYVKELETKIKSLESQSAKTTHENAQLKSLVEQLQTENYFLKQSTFSFDFSLEDNGKTTENSLALDKSIADLLLSPNQPSQPKPLPVDPVDPVDPSLNTLSIDLDPFTPPSSNESDEELTFEPIDLFAEADFSQTSQTTKPSSVKPQNAQEFYLTTTNNMQNSVSTDNSKSKSADYTRYRDPTPFTASIDNPYSESEPIPPLFEGDFESFGSYAPMQTPGQEIKNPLGAVFSIEDIRDKKYLSCNKVWEKIQQHPNFDDFQGDEIDNLCNELKSKAKCSGHGPVVPEEEVDKILVKLEEKDL